MAKVQGLVVAANMGWGEVASPYTVHWGDEVLWNVRGVDIDMNSAEVTDIMLKNLEPV